MTNARKAVLPEEDGIAFQHSEVTKEHTNMKKIAIHSNCAYNTSMTAHYASQVNGMINHLTAMIPEQATAKNMHLLRKIAEKSYLLADEVYSASDAEAWGNGYVVSDELIDSDERLFKSSMRDTDKTTKRRQNPTGSIKSVLNSLFVTIIRRKRNYCCRRRKECRYF